jgi:hypothetical protein
LSCAQAGLWQDQDGEISMSWAFSWQRFKPATGDLRAVIWRGTCWEVVREGERMCQSSHAHPEQPLTQMQVYAENRWTHMRVQLFHVFYSVQLVHSLSLSM